MVENKNMAPFTRSLFALFLFAASFGYVEATVVAYLRPLYEPLHRQIYPSAPDGDLFPLVTLEQLQSAEPKYRRWLAMELVREAGTMIMLASVALAAARNFRQWFAGFLIVFGVWDIFFYLSLKLLLDWPESLSTWDLLFLLPVPWAGPVGAPVLVAASMIAAGLVLLWRESSGRATRLDWRHWALIFAGGLIVVTAFCWDYRHLMAGGLPRDFPWPVLLAGEAIGLCGFGHGVWKK